MYYSFFLVLSRKADCMACLVQETIKIRLYPNSFNKDRQFSGGRSGSVLGQDIIGCLSPSIVPSAVGAVTRTYPADINTIVSRTLVI
jgi:hypothetical protein